MKVRIHSSERFGILVTGEGSRWRKWIREVRKVLNKEVEISGFILGGGGGEKSSVTYEVV